MTEIRITEHQEQLTAAVRERVAMQELGEFFPRAFAAAMSAAAAQGVEVTGPPFGKYYGAPSSTVDVEAGFPVSRPIREADGVTTGVLPGGTVIEAVHVGPYDALPDTYRDLEQWLAEHGVTTADVMWESYLSDPEASPDPATWRTLLVLPVAPPPEGTDGAS